MVGLQKHNLSSLRELAMLPLNHEAQGKILEALRLEPFLTINQIARLFYSVKRDGTPAKATTFRPRPTSEYTLTPGYHSARAILSRMVRDKKLVKHKTIEKSRPNLYSLPKVKKPYDDRHLYGHEMDCADVFCALWASGKLERWERRWDPEQRKEIGERFKVWPDRIFELSDSDHVFFLEIDRGTEELEKQIKPKIDNYIRLAHAFKGQAFAVLFTAQGYRHHFGHQERFTELSRYVRTFNKGARILVSLHTDVLTRPFEPIWTGNPDLPPIALSQLDSLNA